MKKKFSYGIDGKLVRDKSVDMIMSEDHKAKVSYRYLTKEGFRKHLLLKLVEEAQEVLEAKDGAELEAELADVLQVIEAIKKENNITQEKLEVAMNEKIALRGSFEKGLFIEWIEIGPCRLSEYCSAYPNKYPVLKEDCDND